MNNATASMDDATNTIEVSNTILDAPNIDSTLPDWFLAVRQQGWEEFEALPFPGRKDELWRFSSLKALDLTGFVPAPLIADEREQEIIERSRGVSHPAGRMVFGNGELLFRKAIHSELRNRGVLFLPLEEAVFQKSELVKEHFMTQEFRLGSAKLAALHKANAGAGTLIYVPRNVEVELPLEIFHWIDGENTSLFPHTLIVAGENSKVTVLEHFGSADLKQRGFACSVNDLILGPGAKLTYVSVQDWNENVTSFQINSTVVERDASAVNMGLNLGALYARYESASRLRGPGGRSDMLAVTVADGEQEFDQRTLQDHAQPNCTSDLLYKNALSDRSRTIFSGLIKVEEHSHKTDAYQKVRNLMLSEDAEANSMPGLEILADDVRCTHGATSGQIEDEELFYLLSRGIPADDGRQLLVTGFLNEAIDRLGQSELEDLLRSRVADKFARIKASKAAEVRSA